jgi:hypothetical protein
MAIYGLEPSITQIVANWPGISLGENEFGGTEYLLDNQREIGHVHDDLGVVDIPVPAKVRERWIAAGRAEPHHIFPKHKGMVSFWLREPEDVQRAIELLREAYELAVEQRERRQAKVAS